MRKTQEYTHIKMSIKPYFYSNLLSLIFAMTVSAILLAVSGVTLSLIQSIIFCLKSSFFHKDLSENLLKSAPDQFIFGLAKSLMSAAIVCQLILIV
jgi:hypothetical protein